MGHFCRCDYLFGCVVTDTYGVWVRVSFVSVNTCLCVVTDMLRFVGMGQFCCWRWVACSCCVAKEV